MSKLIRCLCSIGGSLLLTGLCMTGFPVFADGDGSFTENGITFAAVAGGVQVKGAESDTEKLTIPAETSDGTKVLRIADNAFTPCTSLKEVTISDGLTEIGSGAFSQCTALKTISIPDSVTKIGQGAFYYCMALETLELPDSVKEIGEYAFSNCYALQAVRLPRGLNTLPGYAFYYDIGLTEIELPAGMEHISEMCFVKCMSLKKVSIPASLSDINAYSMLSCMGLETIEVDPTNRIYRTNDQGWLVTKDGTSLVLYPAGTDSSTASVPNGITTIMPYAFSGSLALEEVKLPDSLTEIGDGAFADCRMLKTINLPFRLTTLPPSLFANCVSLTAAMIPANVTAIGDYAFYGTGLTEITIPESVTQIGSYAFCGCNDLTEVSIPKTVTDIDEMAFGYTIDTEAENAQPVLNPSFVLHGTPASAAKKYASETGVKFKQHGIDTTVLICVIAGAVAAAAIAVSLIRSKKKRPSAESKQSGAEEAEITDPNYTSILDEDSDDGDPYDRSYGFSAEDDSNTETDSE